MEVAAQLTRPKEHGQSIACYAVETDAVCWRFPLPLVARLARDTVLSHHIETVRNRIPLQARLPFLGLRHSVGAKGLSIRIHGHLAPRQKRVPAAEPGGGGRRTSDDPRRHMTDSH